MRNDVIFGLYLSTSAICFSIIYTIVNIYDIKPNIEYRLFWIIFSSFIAGILLYSVVKRIIKYITKNNI